MRSIAFAGALVALAASTGPAEASCFFNKAICQAICGLDCCSTYVGNTPTNQAALSRIALDDLVREKEGLKRSEAGQAFSRILDKEIRSRR